MKDLPRPPVNILSMYLSTALNSPSQSLLAALLLFTQNKSTAIAVCLQYSTRFSTPYTRQCPPYDIVHNGLFASACCLTARARYRISWVSLKELLAYATVSARALHFAVSHIYLLWPCGRVDAVGPLDFVLVGWKLLIAKLCSHTAHRDKQAH